MISVLSLVIFVGFGIALATLYLLIRATAVDRLSGIGIDKPDGLRKTHPHPIPRLGGIGLFLSLLVLHLAARFFDAFPEIQGSGPVLIGSTLIFCLGLADDLRSLTARTKLFGQIVIAVLMWSLGLRIELVTDFFPEYSGFIDPTVSFLATVFWLIAIPNVVNLADGMDGLVGGVGLFLFATLGIVGIASPFHQGLGLISFGMAGAMVAFLFFNLPPAKIYLGDGGAYLIGFYIAAASLGSSQKGYVAASLTVTMIALGLPIMDTIFTFCRRALKGVPVMRGDAEHIHHRLLTLGMSSGKVLFVFYGIFLVLSILALMTVFYERFSLWLAAGFLVLLGLIVLRGLGFVRRWRTLGADFHRLMTARREVRFASTIARSLEYEIERHEKDDAETFWALFASEIERLDLSVSPTDGDRKITLEVAYHDLDLWILWDTAKVPGHPISRMSTAGCLVTPLCLAVRKFGHPGWQGLN